MPSVSTLLTTIKDLALVGTGDSDDDDRIMRYMNMLYKEAYRTTSKAYPTLLLTTENVTVTSGSGTISATPFIVMRVKDNSNNRFLKPTTLLALEEKYPSLSDTNSPSWYYITGTATLNTYPSNSFTAVVRYIPQAATLTSTSTESDIKIPPEFHDMLVWGTLIYMAHDERDKAFGVEMQVAQTKYEIAKADFQSWLHFSQTKEKNRTEVVLGD